MGVKKANQEEHLKENVKKFGAIVMERGFTVVPSTLLIHQHALALNPTDVNILLQLWRYWWYADRLPFPSHSELAKTIGISISTVKRSLSQLEKDGLIEWEQRYLKNNGQTSNLYSFNGLIQKLKEFAEEDKRVTDEQKAENNRLNRRKRPKVRSINLKLIEGDDKV